MQACTPDVMKRMFVALLMASVCSMMAPGAAAEPAVPPLPDPEKSRALPVFGPAAKPAAVVARGSKEKKGLFSADPKEILEYLKLHRIPHIPFGGHAPSPTEPQYVAEVKQALTLFKKGNPELRLAIAGALWSGAGKEPLRAFWEACNKDDRKARHLLAGLCLSEGGERTRLSCWRWVTKEANPGLGGLLLSSINESIYSDIPKTRHNEILPLLTGLYRQQGTVRRPRVLPDDTGGASRTRPLKIQTAAVQMLPDTPQARDLLLKWIIADGKKADPDVVGGMWSRWSRMVTRTELMTQKFLTQALARTEVAEAWLLGSHGPTHFCRRSAPNFDKMSRLAQEGLWRQLDNPDPRVRRQVIIRRLRKAKDVDALQFISAMRIPVHRGRQIVVEAKKICAELKASIKTGDKKDEAERLDKSLGLLERALQGKPIKAIHSKKKRHREES